MEYFETIKRNVKDLDIALLVVNAGCMSTGRFDKITSINLQQMLDANVYHFAAMLKKFIPNLLARSNKSGVIITSSVASLTPLANNSTYHASKKFEY
jgi:short-subunit dehydrogenase